MIVMYTPEDLNTFPITREISEQDTGTCLPRSKVRNNVTHSHASCGSVSHHREGARREFLSCRTHHTSSHTEGGSGARSHTGARGEPAGTWAGPPPGKAEVQRARGRQLFRPAPRKVPPPPSPELAKPRAARLAHSARRVPGACAGRARRREAGPQRARETKGPRGARARPPSDPPRPKVAGPQTGSSRYDPPLRIRGRRCLFTHGFRDRLRDPRKPPRGSKHGSGAVRRQPLALPPLTNPPSPLRESRPLGETRASGGGGAPEGRWPGWEAPGPAPRPGPRDVTRGSRYVTPRLPRPSEVVPRVSPRRCL
ncbi:uncharacterized protein LOC144315350 [Canis aureus]